MRGVGKRCVAIAMTAMACVAWAPAPAQAFKVRISAPSLALVTKPCRVVVSVPKAIRAKALLQERKGRGWRTVSKRRLGRGSARLRCPAGAAGTTRRFRVLVRRGGHIIARSAVIKIHIRPRRSVQPAPGPTKAPPTPSPVPGPARPPPINPAQFGVEGTGGPPSPQTLALLANPKIILTAVQAADLRAGRIDPRIVAVLTTLAEAHTITVSALCSDHAKFTTGGSVSHHFRGRGVDIAAIDGVPVNAGNDVAHELTAGLASFDITSRPDSIGSPWFISGPGYFTDAEHQDHLDIAFTQPIDPFWTPPTT
jgi:hypothetical protein